MSQWLTMVAAASGALIIALVQGTFPSLNHLILATVCEASMTILPRFTEIHR